MIEALLPFDKSTNAGACDIWTVISELWQRRRRLRIPSAALSEVGHRLSAIRNWWRIRLRLSASVRAWWWRRFWSLFT